MSLARRRDSKRLDREKIVGEQLFEAGSQLLKTCKFVNDDAYWNVVFDYGMRMVGMKKKQTIILDLEDRYLVGIVEGISPYLNRYSTFNSKLNKFVVTYDREAYLNIFSS